MITSYCIPVFSNRDHTQSNSRRARPHQADQLIVYHKIRRRAIAEELRKNPAYLKDPKIANVFAQLTDDRDFAQRVFLPYIKSLSDEILVFRTWQEVYRRLTSVAVTAEQRLEVFRPLLNYMIDQIHFREYDYIYDLIARCAVFVNDQAAYEKAVQMKNEMQKTKPPFRTYIADQKKQEAR